MELLPKNLMEKMDKDSQYNSASSLHNILLVSLKLFAVEIFIFDSVVILISICTVIVYYGRTSLK